MEVRSMDFASRVSVRAVGAGVAVASAVMIALMLLAAGFGLWAYHLDQTSSLEQGFWVWAFASWIISSYIGGYVAASAARAAIERDGLLQGVTAWAVTCVLGFFLLTISPGNTETIPETFSAGLYWAAFIGDILALVASLYGASLAVRSNERSYEELREVRTPPAA